MALRGAEAEFVKAVSCSHGTLSVVDLPDPRAAEMTALVARHAKDQAAAEYDARIAVQLAKIAEHRRRRAFLLGFAAAPAPFLNALNAAQARELVCAARARQQQRRAVEASRDDSGV